MLLCTGEIDKYQSIVELGNARYEDEIIDIHRYYRKFMILQETNYVVGGASMSNIN